MAEWTTEDVLYLPLERCTEPACTKRHYSELTNEENTRWHAMSSVHLTSLAAHDAEVRAQALGVATERALWETLTVRPGWPVLKSGLRKQVLMDAAESYSHLGLPESGRVVAFLRARAERGEA